MKHRLWMLLLAFGGTHAVAQEVPWTRVMMNGDVVQALGSEYFFTGYASGPLIDSSGRVAFEGLFTGPDVNGRNNRANFAGTPDLLDMLIRSTDPLPGGRVGELYDSHVSLGFANGRAIGQITIRGNGVDGTNDRAILVGNRDGFELLARTGFPPSNGTRPQAQLSSVPFQAFSGGALLTESGRSAFLGDFDLHRQQRAVWTRGPEGSYEVAATGRTAPGFGSDDVFASGFSLPAISDTGVVSFAASVEGPNIGTIPALFRGDETALDLIAYRGQHLPGFVGNDTFREFGVGPSINNNNHLAFPAYVRVDAIDQPSVWRVGGNGVPRPVFLGTEQLPDTPFGSTTDRIESVTINDLGTIAFAIDLNSDSNVNFDNDDGIYVWLNETIQTVYREGTVIDSENEVVIGDPQSISRLTEQNRLAFEANVRGPGGIDGRGLFSWNSTDGLTTIAYEGQTVALADDDLRTIKFIDFAGSFQDDRGTGGSPRGLNDEGLMTFGIRFEDGTSGIFTLNPSPSSLAPFAVFVVCARRRRVC